MFILSVNNLPQQQENYLIPIFMFNLTINIITDLGSYFTLTNDFYLLLHKNRSIISLIFSSLFCL